jgi:ribonuclease P protein component
MAIGRRFATRAVVRNRMKRIVREVFRVSSLPALDVVVLARPGADKVDSARLRADLTSALKALGQ